MKRSATKGLVLLVILVSTLVGGCTDDKAQITALTNKNESLMMQNKDYREQILELEDFNTQLKDESTGKDTLLSKKDQEIARLQDATGKSVPQPALAGGWERGKFGDRVTVGSDILFASGRATLRASGKRTLGRIVGELNDRYAGLPVRVYGYTDSDPIRRSKKLWKDNLDLSSNRAMAVVRYLISRGVPKENIESIGMGDSNPVASNSTGTGKTKNRRVEIVVVKMGD
jgi:chemotaxis protein MotB